MLKVGSENFLLFFRYPFSYLCSVFCILIFIVNLVAPKKKGEEKRLILLPKLSS